MLKCDDWTPLIARAVDGVPQPDPAAGERLLDHLGRCARCRLEVRAQLLVKQAVAARPDEPVPAAFSARLAAALDEESSSRWIDLANWRTWGLRLLPAAAALLAGAVIAEQQHLADQSVDLSSAVASWGTEEGGVTELMTRTDLSVDSLLVAIVTGRPDVDVTEK